MIKTEILPCNEPTWRVNVGINTATHTNILNVICLDSCLELTCIKLNKSIKICDLKTLLMQPFHSSHI